jgi:uncharacterized protein (DUF1697 family)
VAATHIVLLRGVNVGPNNRVPMAVLRRLLEELGYTGVRTLLNSGNAVVTAPAATNAEVGRAVATAIEKELGLSIRVMVRTPDQVREAIERNPLTEAEGDPKLFHVGFCDPAPDPAAFDGVDHDALAPEQLALDGDTLYLWYAGGMQNSPLARLLTRMKLDVAVTLRNWNTVRKLVELADG